MGRYSDSWLAFFPPSPSRTFGGTIGFLEVVSSYQQRNCFRFSRNSRAHLLSNLTCLEKNCREYCGGWKRNQEFLFFTENQVTAEPEIERPDGRWAADAGARPG